MASSLSLTSFNAWSQVTFCHLPPTSFIGVLQAMRVVRHAVLADRGALGAVRAEVDRRIEHRLLPYPHAVLHHGVDRAADGAMRADRALDLDLAAAGILGGFRLADDVERQLRGNRTRAERDARTLEESAAVYGPAEHP